MRSLYRIGGTAALLQLVVILGYALVAAVFGPKPETADAYLRFTWRARWWLPCGVISSC